MNIEKINCGLILGIASELSEEMRAQYFERIEAYAYKPCPCYLAKDQNYPCKYAKEGGR